MACTVAWLEKAGISPQTRRRLNRGFLALALIVGTRAIGMSTWGAANARDISHATALLRVRSALEECPAHSTVVVSAAFLYEANSFRELRALHADWLASYRQPHDHCASLISLRPEKLILTQFDWYRRYKPVVAQLAMQRDLVQVTIQNAARVRPPDAYPQFQKILQHTSWTPVVVELKWKNNGFDSPKTAHP
ncbi:MAG: hypothetical protein MUF81_15795 [Verrucomicrobia bacterium]|nr:hypothetical protein [Verrucomicrobiota bacterium]